MRYCKGSTIISRHNDVPLLLHVRNARFLGHQQLFELLEWDATSPSRHSYDWRMHRLLKSGYIERVDSMTWQGSPVYSIAKNGLAELESQGECCLALNSSTRQRRVRAEILHSLELNDIQLSLIRNSLLVDWKGELSIGSFNMIAREPFQKDYDAIVQIWVGDQVREFALEYERTLKSAKRYERIIQALESESLVDCILYLTADPILLRALVQKLTPSYRRIGFATARAFREQGLGTSIIGATKLLSISAEQFLATGHPRSPGLTYTFE